MNGARYDRRCAVFRAERGKPHTSKRKYRCAEGKNMTHIPFVTTGAYPVRAGNRVHPLIDGEPAFRRICDAIDQAQARVWVAVTFLWATFQMPDRRGSFFEVLTRARQRGLAVQV